MADDYNIVEKLGPYKENALYGIIFSGIILLIVLAVILPYSHMVKKMNVEIKKLENELAAQELQAPLYKSLIDQLSKNTIEGLKLPAEEKLRKNEISRISFIIKDIADKSGLTYKKSNPDINSLEKNNGRLSVDMEITGAFIEFRNFILSLNEIPYLEDIETLAIRSDGTDRIFDLRIWLSIE